MKKKIIILSTFLMLLIFPLSAKAVSVRCSGPASVTVGQTVTVTISGSADVDTYWNGSIVNYSSNLRSNFGNGSYVESGAKKSVSKQYSFTALSVGTATVSQTVNYANSETDYNDRSAASNNCTINIVAANSSNSSNNNSGKTQASVSNANKKKPDPNKSSNNNLKSITIEGVELSPEFNKDTLEYGATVEGNIEKITVNAEAEDGKSHIDGLGEKELVEGLNEIVIYVNAENGDVKEYKINITRKEKNPIEVVIDGKKYTVVKKETEMEVPEGFEKKTITINEEEVVAYESKYTSSVLVVLVDEEGNTGFYIYDAKKNTYTRYIEFKSKEIKLMLLEPKEDIPFKYKKSTFTIDGQKINGYCYKAKSKFRLVYGINMDNGDEGFYLYDMEQKTFQRFYNDQLEEYVVYGKYALYIAAGVVGVLLILFISVIVLSTKNRRLKKKLKNSPVEEEPKEEKKEEPRALTRAERLKMKEEAAKALEAEEQKEEEKPSKKELKRLEKEAKLKEKEEKKLAKEEPKEEPSVETEESPEDFNTKELKRIQKEEAKKLKEEAKDFLK